MKGSLRISPFIMKKSIKTLYHFISCKNGISNFSVNETCCILQICGKYVMVDDVLFDMPLTTHTDFTRYCVDGAIYSTFSLLLLLSIVNIYYICLFFALFDCRSLSCSLPSLHLPHSLDRRHRRRMSFD